MGRGGPRFLAFFEQLGRNERRRAWRRSKTPTCSPNESLWNNPARSARRKYGSPQDNRRGFDCIAIATVLATLLAATVNGAELPAEIQVDRLLVQAERESREGDYWSAVLTLERVLETAEEYGLATPSTFWFRQASALSNAGLHESAMEASTRYLREAGRDGQHYQAALELLDAAEVAFKAEARREAARAQAAAERAVREAEARRAAITPSTPEMVAIPAGEFRMGCVTGRQCTSIEKPIREVQIESFELSKYEVTFAQWDRCVEYGGCRGVKDGGWGRDDRPVIHVTWGDAQAYVAWLSREMGETYRLPSEAEWEYAARARTETLYGWGNERGRGQANCDGCRCVNCGDRTSPAGSFPQNPFGLHEMYGNALEWVQDCWHDSYREAPADGTARETDACTARVARGGAWDHKPKQLRAAARWGIHVTRDYRGLGFRVARTLDQ